jgi:hypothetical protein
LFSVSTVGVTIATVPPSLSIGSPADPTTAYSRSPVLFKPISLDSIGRNLATSVAWVSNLDGALGSGTISSEALTVGTHIVTASVSDAKSVAATSVSVVVGIILAPSDGEAEISITESGAAGLELQTNGGEVSIEEAGASTFSIG